MTRKIPANYAEARELADAARANQYWSSGKDIDDLIGYAFSHFADEIRREIVEIVDES